MLKELLEKAVTLGADEVESEYQGSRAWIMAISGSVGVSIGSVPSEDAPRLLFAEMKEMKRARQKLTVGGKTYRLSFSQYESFGEWTQVIKMKPAGPAATSPKRSSRPSSRRSRS